MASKGGRDKIKLESTAGTGHFYTVQIQKQATQGRQKNRPGQVGIDEI